MTRKGIRNVVAYFWKRCHRAYWSADSHRGLCDACRNMQRKVTKRKKNRKLESAGQMVLPGLSAPCQQQ